MRQKLINVTLLILMLIFLWSCDQNRNRPGYDFLPDMKYSQAYETNSENPNFEDGMTMRVPVKGTVPMDYYPFEYTIDEKSRIKAGNELVNPFSPTEEALTRGKEVYATFCIHCHGVSGDGDGVLYTSGLYPVKPRSLSGESAALLKDGQIYHSIMLGFGPMGAHSSQIRPDDRWKIVIYIRKLQQEFIPDMEPGKK